MAMAKTRRGRCQLVTRQQRAAVGEERGVQPAGDWAIFISLLAKINAGPFQFMAK